MKKLLVVFSALFLMVSSASAFEIGIMGGWALGTTMTSELVGALGNETPEPQFTNSPDIYLTLPHSYGDSKWVGIFQIGFIALGPDVAYNLGYKFNFGDLFTIAPYVGASYDIIYGIGYNLGLNGRMALGIGDLTLDLAYRASHGVLSFMNRDKVSIDLGYTFLFGKSKR